MGDVDATEENDEGGSRPAESPDDLRLLEYIAEQLRLDLMVLDAQHRPRLVTHRARALLERLDGAEYARLARTLMARLGEAGVAIAHVETGMPVGLEVYAFPLLDGLAIVLSGPRFARIPLDRGLRALYELTAAEARIARALATDKTPRGIAEEFGISLSTVRTHLRVIQAKLRATSQTDLVRRLLSSAASFGSDDAPAPVRKRR